MRKGGSIKCASESQSPARDASVPMLRTAACVAAAAVASWNGGRGEWAQTSPAGRIAKVEELVKELKPKRDEIISARLSRIDL